MKINHLSIAGFLSYQETVTIDFTQFDLACITGENGAGKSSILDAITWNLFGKCRQSNESLINLQSDEAIVSFSFEYSGESYKIRRSNKRGKPARLTLKTPELDLTERTTRDTQNKIESILKIDYDTFIHAVFFLQGESDQFVTASPGQRKQVLFDILGLDAWEKFRLSAAAEIKKIEKSMEQAQGSMQILEEDVRKAPEVVSDLEIVEDELPAIEEELSIAQISLDEGQKKKNEWLDWKAELTKIKENKQIANGKRNELNTRVQSLLNQQRENAEIISRKEQIVKDYARSKELTQLLGDFGTKEIEHGKLQNSLSGLETKLQEVEDNLLEIPEHEKDIDGWSNYIDDAEKYEIQVNKIKENQIKWNAEAVQKAAEKHELSAQIEGLAGHSECPLCKQALKNPEELINLLAKERDNLAKQEQQLWEEIENGGDAIDAIQGKFESVSEYRENIATAKATIESVQKAHKDFDLNELRDIEEKIELLDYDKAAGQELRNESELVSNAPRDHGLLEGAEKIGESLDIQIKGLNQDLFDVDATIKEYQTQIESKEGLYPADYPVNDNEMTVLAHARDEARMKVQLKNQQIGELTQIIKSIEEKKQKLKEIKSQEKENTELHQNYSILQEAFSKKGVPALLVEQALPQIESKANQLLSRLSDGNMAVHFITQKAYSDSSREDMKETLDIEIQDQAGIRDYEMYSGGESFRINFAIRMALSHVLANRAGAKLRTLVIDEGFGSQDAGGRDRLINAINTVKEEYDKVLVITHIPEVIEAFPVQLRIEKTAAGSQVRIS